MIVFVWFLKYKQDWHPQGNSVTESFCRQWFGKEVKQGKEGGSLGDTIVLNNFSTSFWSSPAMEFCGTHHSSRVLQNYLLHLNLTSIFISKTSLDTQYIRNGSGNFSSIFETGKCHDLEILWKYSLSHLVELNESSFHLKMSLHLILYI